MNKIYVGVNNADLEVIDTYLDQEDFYYCKQPKLFNNYYAKEPKDGDTWYPEYEYPLEEEYDDQLHRELLTIYSQMSVCAG